MNDSDSHKEIEKCTKDHDKTSDTDDKSMNSSLQKNNDDKLIVDRLLNSQMELSLQKLKQFHIFIATPCYGGQVTEPYFRSMMRLQGLCDKYDIRLSVSTIANESLITRGRNTLVSYFMEYTEATHLFFIDADIEFQAIDVLRMVHYDKPVVVGAYPKKAIDWESIFRHATNENKDTLHHYGSKYAINFDITETNGTYRMQVTDNLIKLQDASTGFMCIQKNVIQQLFDTHPELKYKNDINVDQKFEKHMYALFDTMIDPSSKRYLSEDYTFCRRWQALGGTILLDPRTNLNHIGHFSFDGNIKLLFESFVA